MPTARRDDLAIRAKSAIEIHLRLNTACVNTAPAVQTPVLDRFRMAGAVVHLRVSEDGKSRTLDSAKTCYVTNEALGSILAVARASTDLLPSGMLAPAPHLVVREQRDVLPARLERHSAAQRANL